MSMRQEIIQEIEDEATRRAGEDPETHYVISAKAAIAVIGDLDFDFDREVVESEK